MLCVLSQEWSVAAHCFSQAKDWLRHAACKANHMLYSKSGQDHEAAVLLVEAAAGAAKRHKQLTTGGSDGLTPVTLEDYTSWLHTAALVFEQRLDCMPEAIALYCQVGFRVRWGLGSGFRATWEGSWSGGYPKAQLDAHVAKRHKQLTTGGCDGLAPVTLEDCTVWLHTAALVFEQQFDRMAEGIALYCQVGLWG